MCLKLCGTLGLCPADLRITSKMQEKSAMLFVVDWNVCGVVGFLYVEEKQFYWVVEWY